MRVALTFPGCHRRGGVERIMLECANFLSRRGHDTHVFASEFDEQSLDPAVTRHPVTSAQRPALVRLAAFKSKSTRDLQTLNPPADVHAAFGVISPPGGVIWVQSVHRAWLEISQRSRGLAGRLKQRANLTHPYILRLERQYFAGRQYAKVIALTEQVKADLMRFYNVPDRDIALVPNGFSPTEFNLANRAKQRPRMRQQLGYATTDKVVVVVANEMQRKGFVPLLCAIASLNDPSIKLLAVGRLNPRACEAELKELNLGGRVHFTGPTSNVADYYAAADVFALPTVYEAWGLVIVEAMACGLPVLTSRLAGASIAVEENHTGLLLENPADESEIAQKLSSLLHAHHDSPESIARSVAHYAWSEVLLDYEQIILSAARTNPLLPVT
jgi:UDP-glucose:(heptosyl)LPS alpha-1,3-glucosyltransferase